MFFTQCPFCHKSIFCLFRAGHIARHIQRGPDGQMADHITLPEDQREQGSLEGVPKVYVHQRCGVATGMPEEIIRSYLKNPFLYNDMTFCCGCNDYVKEEECVWEETGEKLSDYKRKLQEECVRRHNQQPSRGRR